MPDELEVEDPGLSDLSAFIRGGNQLGVEARGVAALNTFIGSGGLEMRSSIRREIEELVTGILNYNS